MNFVQKIGFAASSALLSVSAFAAGPSAGDLSSLTPDTGTVLTAIAAIGAVVIGVTLAKRGVFTAKGMANKV